MSSSDAPADEVIPGNASDQLQVSRNTADKLRSENRALQKDKKILEEIIVEKDKLINNLQLQIQNLQNFSTTIHTTMPTSKPVSELPPRSQYRSVSNPVQPTVDQTARATAAAAPTAKPDAALIEQEDGDDTANDERTITEASEAVGGGEPAEPAPEPAPEPQPETAPETAPEPRPEDPPTDDDELPQRNPNHRIPPINLPDTSPAKSEASSQYSPFKSAADNAAARLAQQDVQRSRTPPISPTKPQATDRHHYMDIPADAVWGSSPKRDLSPLRARNVNSLSPLRGQLGASGPASALGTPQPEARDDEEEFIFSPIGAQKNGSTASMFKSENVRNSVASANSFQTSVKSSDLVSVSHNGNSSADLESVVKYMDKRLSAKESRNTPRSRASTASSLYQTGELHQQSQARLNSSTKSSFVNSGARTEDLNPFDTGSPIDFNAPSSKAFPQSATSTPASRNLSTPSTATAARFDNFDEEELKDLMVRPNDLQTTLVAVVSVIDGSQPPPTKKKADDPAMTFGCFLVENSGERREIFKFSKTYSQLVEFDSQVRPHFFELLPLPEMTSFTKTTPNSIEFRRQILNNYFYKLYELRTKPKALALAICRFVSTDPVFKFDFNEHIIKEGFVLRKAAGKLGTAWKVNYCVVYGNTMELTDQANGKKQSLPISECKLINEEDARDIRHAISIFEPKKNVLSASHNRILLCAESYEDKLEWLEALAKGSSNNFINPQIKSSSESVLSVPSASDQSPDNSSFKYSHSYSNSKLSSPTVSDAPATPRAQSFTFDDSATISSSISRPRKLGGLFSKIKDKSTKNPSPEKTDGMITPSTAIEPVTNLENYQQQAQQQQSAYTSTEGDQQYGFTPYSPGMGFSSGPDLFGSSLEEAIRLSATEYKGRLIPSICYRCIAYLEKKDAIYSEGIFRLTGKSSEINLLNQLFNHKYDVDFDELDSQPDADSISTLLKRYLRSLSESVITPTLVSALKQAPENDDKALYYKEKVGQLLPKINTDLLYILLEYLIKVIKNKEYNKMDINNIVMLFSVNFNVDESVLAELIIDFDYIFNGASHPVPQSERPFLRR